MEKNQEPEQLEKSQEPEPEKNLLAPQPCLSLFFTGAAINEGFFLSIKGVIETNIMGF